MVLRRRKKITLTAVKNKEFNYANWCLVGAGGWKQWENTGSYVIYGWKDWLLDAELTESDKPMRPKKLTNKSLT